MAGLLCAVATLAVTGESRAAEPVEPASLRGVTAEREVVDTILAPTRKARAAGAVTQRFSDAHGHAITISTDLPGVDLGPFAGVLAATRHGNELNDLRVEAVTLALAAQICGDPDAVACYMPDDPGSSSAGQMWFAVDDPDVVHTIVHEYGHHMDNQLVNLAHLGLCGFGNDGSRNWFFARDLEDGLLDAGFGCSSEQDWEHLLGELFAEDFVVLNGIRGWTLSSARSPSDAQLAALDRDIADPFVPEMRWWRPRVRHDAVRTTSVRVGDWTVLDVTLTSPPARDFDLYVLEPGRDRPLARSRKTGRRDRIQTVVPPGRYVIVAHGYRGSGRARLAIGLD